MKGEHGDVDEVMEAFGEEIWRGSEESSIFCDVFPALPDFPCMSSTSSSSSNPALNRQFVSSSASSGCSASSSAVVKSDGNLRSVKYEVDVSPSALSSTDCMGVMEEFGYMDLIEDGNEGWDPSSIFRNDDETNVGEELIDQGGFKEEERVEEEMGLDELGVMFFEWLKTNKEHISAEDMKNIRFKKSTIECAYKRMGSSKEGKKQLLKLILEWVEQYQLQKKRSREAAEAAAEAASSHQVPCLYQEPNPNPNPNSNFVNFMPTPGANACMWIPIPQSSSIDPPAVVPSGPAPPAVAYYQPYPFVGGANVGPVNCQPYPPQMPQPEYQMLESPQLWPRSQFVLAPQYNSFPDQNGNFVPIAPHPVAPVYGEQYPSQVYNGSNSDRVVRLAPSATKEARQKRMARKRWGSFHRNQPHQNQIQKTDSPEQISEKKLGAENFTNSINGQSSPVNWLYWPAVGPPKLAQPPMAAQSQQPDQYQQGYPTFLPVKAQSNRRPAQQQQKKQGFKGEKNLKFLLQKVLKQSDVGCLGRIVLPKREAETQLPQLEDRDGIQIVMEDIGTSKVWNLRYSLRYWPNNKSRMYVLENTGEFVKENGLQEGDFIVIYSDIKCGKYLIRGVKVRQPVKGKLEAKVTRKHHSNSGAGTDIPQNHSNSGAGTDIPPYTPSN
ncbi:B3 domain-containing transcription factor ABI3 isoform X1 [Daucus carota subsp. sativus]|uniref:B3 domain-containing transcription factor ABI3 isoform X1 n=1 Tax=Daucus carota subsp. sativus TaxID=79200 RepID=UPI0007EFF9C3|nr:PREDICTED: B3 domain-containing transcription factor ABI3-like isoform X1 [Daucus carota subsp. sativus]